MIREIKFRVLNTESKTKGYIEITNKNSGCGWVQSLHTVFMQFTGLHDKNGKEIYEGDIVKGRPVFGSGIVIEVIEWDDEIEQSCGNGYAVGYPFLVDIKDCEVIGNIYENPELLH